jgi:hypothetical protein
MHQIKSPIIVKFLTEVCIQNRDQDNVSVIKCTGLDEHGQRWQFYLNNYYRWNVDGTITVTTSHLYGFTKMTTA